MKAFNEFPEVSTHDLVYKLVRDTIEPYGGKIAKHDYDPLGSAGRLWVECPKFHTHTTIPYGLPDHRDEIKTLALDSMQHPAIWKADITREQIKAE